MKIFFYSFIFSVCLSFCFERTVFSQNQNDFFIDQFYHSLQLYNEGNYESAKRKLTEALTNNELQEYRTKIAYNNLLGLLNRKLNRYDKATFYYKENLKLIKPGNLDDISKTLMNLGNIHKEEGLYVKSIEDYEEAVRIIRNLDKGSNKKTALIASFYYNIGIVYFKKKVYPKALDYYTKSLSLREQNKLSGTDKIYFNLARTYRLTKEYTKADSCFIKAIDIREQTKGTEYFRLAPFYMFYGDFLREQKRYVKAESFLLKAKKLYENYFGLQHPYTANSYVYLGKYYTSILKHDSALYQFQKSLIVNSKTFLSEDIKSNPELSECLSELQLLRSLKYKTTALFNIGKDAEKNKQLEYYKLGLNTVQQALNVVSEIRSDYTTAANKLVITDEQKICFSLATEISYAIFQHTGQEVFAKQAYYYASLGKASMLSEMLEEELQMKQVVPDSINAMMFEFDRKISNYKKLIYEEQERRKPNLSKISFWKSTLFSLNNEKDELYTKIRNEFNISHQKSKQIFSIEKIQNQLPKQTTLIEYFITTKEETDKQHLFIFTINSEGFHSIHEELSSTFDDNLNTYLQQMNPDTMIQSDLKSFNRLSSASYLLYTDLIAPIEKMLNGKKIIIIPDEKLSYISFDALISEHKSFDCINYSGLSYLIFEYCFSYAYSTHLLFSKHDNIYTDSLFAFAPDYNSDKISEIRNAFGRLSHTEEEINSALEQFNGEAYTGNNASKNSFKSIVGNGGILHFAMHASVDSDKKDFSFLAFSDSSNSKDSNLGHMYAYEIEQLEINSPMVVLSACKTGTGKLYSGEGVMSLARSFIISGVPAVVYSLWDVNDDAGFKIMQSFYENLAERDGKNEALQKAKIKYINKASPTLANPAYWSGYVLSGDVSPVKKDNRLYYILISLGSFLIAFIAVKLLINRKRFTS